MGRKKIYFTDEERRVAKLEAVKRHYAKTHPPKPKPALSSYSPEYHRDRYFRKKELIKQIEGHIIIHKDYCTWTEKAECNCY
jgi:hypothetical protein